MDYAYHYGDHTRLYLNATNRCTCRCSFCVRYSVDGLGGAALWGNEEPDFEMLQTAVLQQGALEEFLEFIWCGYGEPTFRLDLIKEAASWLRSRGAKIRLNTNGHACLIHGRDVLPELAQSVDIVSISLNAPNASRYLELCRPCSDAFSNPADAWEGMIDVLSRAPDYFENVQASVVGFVLTPDEIEQCRALSLSLGVKQFRVR
jgi:TatD family-associated radical SAM protein